MPVIFNTETGVRMGVTDDLWASKSKEKRDDGEPKFELAAPAAPKKRAPAKRKSTSTTSRKPRTKPAS